MGAYPPQSYGGGGGGAGADTRGRTIVVAASNSIDTTLAPAAYRCDGVDDQVEINAAIVALGATGGTVILLEGTYNITASINLASNTTLMGEGAGTLLRIPNGHNADLAVISGNQVSNVLVAELRADGNKANQAAGNGQGVYFNTVTYSKIVNCWMENMNSGIGDLGEGIYLLDSDYITVANNTCVENEDCGICLEGSSYNTIEDNVSYNNDGEGIELYLAGNNGNAIVGNNCQSNGGSGIVLWGASDSNTIVGNISQDNTDHGVYFFTSAGVGPSYCTIAGNVTMGNGDTGIFLDRDCAHNLIDGNNCSTDLIGIHLYSSDNNTITGNNCSITQFYGIELTDSDNNTVTGNTCGGPIFVTGPDVGIGLFDSNYNLITGNTCNQNLYDGIHLEGSSYNNITGNTASENNQYGISIISSSSNNTIASNNIVGNSQQADDTYDGILIDTNSDYNTIQCNTVRHGGGAAQQKYGIDIAWNTCDGNLVIDNDLYNAGKTADYNDAGTNTIYHNNRNTGGWVP
jgi:parallel beta-helix repeat protein